MPNERAAWRQAENNINTVLEAGKKGAIQSLKAVGTEGTNIVKTMLTNPSPGRPGGPPGLIYGGLRGSYEHHEGGEADEHYTAIGSNPSATRPVTGEDVDYAKYLEGKFPHLRPSMALLVPLVGPIIRAGMISSMEAANARLKATPNR